MWRRCSAAAFCRMHWHVSPFSCCRLAGVVRGVSFVLPRPLETKVRPTNSAADGNLLEKGKTGESVWYVRGYGMVWYLNY